LLFISVVIISLTHDMGDDMMMTINTQRRLFLKLAAAAPLAAVILQAKFARAAQPAIFTGLIDGTGAGGYDVVAYQAENMAKPGDAGITATHEGVTYRFVSTANLETFKANPAKYLPAYGGYCAYAVANGYTAKIDPEAFTVVGGRLYLNYSKGVRSKWAKDIPGNISAANGNWPKVLEN
jgi:YHS domain-containing protein